MQSFDFKKLLPNILVIVGFAVLALLYCYPQLEGKVLDQHDVRNWKAMAQEGTAYHEQTGENVLWSNSMFGGMPTFTYYVPESNNFIYPLQTFIVDIMGKPACFIFVAMLCFYLLMRVLRVNQWVAVVGAIAYAFSSFNLVSIVAGHETKVFTMSYLPAMLAGIILIYRAKWWTGITVLGLSLSLMVANAHYQILYYSMIIVLFAVVGLFFIALKERTLKQFFISSMIALATAGIAAGPSMQSILSTVQYGKATMRGGESELTVNRTEVKKSGGLDKEYAFRWSNGIGETLCFMIPGLYGGSVGEKLGENSNTAETLANMGVPEDAIEQVTSRLPLYWGPQPLLYGPVYFGAIVCFLFVLGMMVIRSPHKWWMFALILLSVIMSWGKNFAGFNYLLFDTLPMLNKFRTPTMVLAVAQLLFPVVALWAVNDIVNGKVSKDDLLKKLKIAVGVMAGICILLGIGGSMFFDYESVNDASIVAQYSQIFNNQQAGMQVLQAIKADRAAMATKSSLFSAVYILLAGALIWAFIKDKIKSTFLVAGLGLLIAIDLISVDSRYLNEDLYVDKSDMEAEFQPRPVDQQILQDPDKYYRVLDVTTDLFNDAMPAYYHKLIGGYSPAKLEIYQDLIDLHLNGTFNSEVLNMLNTKYVIFPADGGKPGVMPNPQANGNAWFVNNIKWVNTADEEILSLNARKLGDTSAPKGPEFDSKNTAVLRNTYQKEVGDIKPGKDSAASIVLTKYGLNGLEFKSENSQNGVAVFSDIYYPYGWRAYIDGKEVPIMRANYVLRALSVPAGNHKIEFKFHPDLWYTGNKMALVCSLLLIGALIVAIIQSFRNKKDSEAQSS